MKIVVYVHRVTCDYSYSFLTKLNEALKKQGIIFRVVSGCPRKDEGLIDVLDDIPFGARCNNMYFGKKLFWSKNVFKFTKDADLIIFEQLNGSLHVYLFVLRRWIDMMLNRIFKDRPRTKIAFMGHGATLNRNKRSFLLDGWKEIFAKKVDWWFAYTNLTKQIIIQAKFPEYRISVFQNTIDTEELNNTRSLYTKKDIESFKEEIFSDKMDMKNQSSYSDAKIGIFCARLVESKRISFMLRSIDEIKKSYPSFHMIIIGDGPFRSEVIEYCKNNKWCVKFHFR